jgi:ribose transport system permease protein
MMGAESRSEPSGALSATSTLDMKTTETTGQSFWRAALNHGLRNRPILIAYGFALALFAAGTAHSVGFAAPSNVSSLLFFGMIIGFVGFGQGLCILVGGVDLSIPWTMTGGAVIVGKSSGHIGVAVAAVLGVALLAGLLNGLGVAYLDITPIIMTLGSGYIFQGLLLIYTNGSGSTSVPKEVTNFTSSSVAGIPTPVVIWLCLIVVGGLFMSKTSIGKQLYAIGSNRRAARLAGIEIRRVLLVPYVISALTGAIAGILLMSYTGGAYLSLGQPYLFASAAAVAVGGASILGGNGHYLGTVGGALVLTFLVALLTLLSVGQAWLNLAYGLILLAALLTSSPDRLKFGSINTRRAPTIKGRD